MPAVGIDSINLSSSDVALEALFFTRGLGETFFTTGFRVVSPVGFGTTTFFVTFGFGVVLLVVGAMGLLVEVGPLPLRPSITIWPSWV